MLSVKVNHFNYFAYNGLKLGFKKMCRRSSAFRLTYAIVKSRFSIFFCDLISMLGLIPGEVC